MAESKKVIELPVITALSSNDRIVVEQIGSNSSTTSTISADNLRKQIIRGPYINDSVANTAGVAVGQLYYTATGDAKVRLI